MKRKTIVVLDDSAIVLSVVETILGAQHHVVTIRSPFELARTLRSARPDLVLVDVTMPALSGDKLVEIARRGLDDANHVPIVLFSDREERELAHLAKQCGASGFIRKTSDPASLVSQVEAYFVDNAKLR